jgi:hypothetical protein
MTRFPSAGRSDLLDDAFVLAENRGTVDSAGRRGDVAAARHRAGEVKDSFTNRGETKMKADIMKRMTTAL